MKRIGTGSEVVVEMINSHLLEMIKVLDKMSRHHGEALEVELPPVSQERWRTLVTGILEDKPLDEHLPLTIWRPLTRLREILGQSHVPSPLLPPSHVGSPDSFSQTVHDLWNGLPGLWSKTEVYFMRPPGASDGLEQLKLRAVGHPWGQGEMYSDGGYAREKLNNIVSYRELPLPKPYWNHPDLQPMRVPDGTDLGDLPSHALGLQGVLPMRYDGDPFVYGGLNSTQFLEQGLKTLNGLPVVPDAYEISFVGARGVLTQLQDYPSFESCGAKPIGQVFGDPNALRDHLVTHNRTVVDEAQSTHQRVMAPLVRILQAMRLGLVSETKLQPFLLNGKKFVVTDVKIPNRMIFIHSPMADGVVLNNKGYGLKNLETNRKLQITPSDVYLAWRYGIYRGPFTPQEVIEFFELGSKV